MSTPEEEDVIIFENVCDINYYINIYTSLCVRLGVVCAFVCVSMMNILLRKNTNVQCILHREM